MRLVKPRRLWPRHALVSGLAALTSAAVLGCRSPESYRTEADDVAYPIIQEVMRAEVGKTEPFTITPAENALRRRLMLDQTLPRSDEASLSSRDAVPWEITPDPGYFEGRPQADDRVADAGVIRLSLEDALRVAAANSRAFQSQKESVYLAALSLDLEVDQFRNTWTGVLNTLFSVDLATGAAATGIDNADSLGLSRQFEGGEVFTALLAIDLVKMLTEGSRAAFGISADFSLSIPLLRGSDEFVVTEPLTQAQRNVVYAVYGFERFKREFSVSIASSYLSVLQALDGVQNAADNYRRVIASTRRAARLAQAGRLPEIQVDQSRQDELSARNGWVSAQQSYQSALDSFKISLGLPTDAQIELDPRELTRLVELPRYARYVDPREAREIEDVPPANAPIVLEGPDPAEAGPLELDEAVAIDLALRHRLDLRIEIGQIVDAQRGVAIAADNLRADVTLLGNATFGESRSLASAGLDDGELRPEEGFYSGLLGIDLPFERTIERNLYRASLVAFEDAVRNMQEAEDFVKLDVREALRTLLLSRESVRIQAESVRVAERRVDSTTLFLDAGRAEIRDLLEAQDDLLSAQNALTSALVNYRVAELEFQRDLGLLEVNEQGLWREYDPNTLGTP